MTVSREQGIVVFQCDGKRCAEIYEADTKDFNEALNEFRETGWVTRKIGNDWLHVCPDCQEVENGLAL